MHSIKPSAVVLLAAILALIIPARTQHGIFEGHAVIGPSTSRSSVTAAVDGRTYTIVGGGSNMWFSADSFTFVWKKVSGDVTLAADIEIPPSDGCDPHRKAVL